MQKTVRIDLEPSEAAVLQAASRIFSAYIASNQCTPENEEVTLQHAIDLAIQMTQTIDTRISAGNEVKSQLQNNPSYRPITPGVEQ